MGGPCPVSPLRQTRTARTRITRSSRSSSARVTVKSVSPYASTRGIRPTFERHSGGEKRFISRSLISMYRGLGSSGQESDPENRRNRPRAPSPDVTVTFPESDAGSVNRNGHRSHTSHNSLKSAPPFDRTALSNLDARYLDNNPGHFGVDARRVEGTPDREGCQREGD